MVVIAKTLSSFIDRVTGKVKELHSYSTPCILAVPVIGGSPEYIAWLAAEVGERES